MKYLSSEPFSTGANSQAYRDNHEDTFRTRRKPRLKAPPTNQYDELYRPIEVRLPRPKDIE